MDNIPKNFSCYMLCYKFRLCGGLGITFILIIFDILIFLPHISFLNNLNLVNFWKEFWTHS